MDTRWTRRSIALLFLVLPAVPAAAGHVELVSRVAPGLESVTAAGNSTVSELAVSADGRYVAFESSAPNLVPGQSYPSFRNNVFLHDRVAGTTTLVSHAAGSPSAAANQSSFAPRISADGRYVAFISQATDLVAGQDDDNIGFGNGGADVFLFDRLSGASTLVSHAAASPTQTGSGESFDHQLSADGRYVAFHSFAGDLVAGQVDANGALDTFLFDRDTGALTLVSHSAASATTTANAASTPTGISGDGRYVVFESAATDLVAGATDANASTDVFLFDRVGGATTLVSRSASSSTTAADAGSFGAQISTDGAWIVLASSATDLVSGSTDANSVPDLFLVERATGTKVLVSHAAGAATTAANGQPTRARISADGGWIAFLSDASNQVAGQVDANGFRDAFLYERASGLVTLVSHAAGSATTTGSGSSEDVSLSADGAYVAFASSSSDLVSGQTGPAFQNVFLWQRASGTTALVSHVLGSSTTTGNLFSGKPVFESGGLALSGDGAWLAYESRASDLVAGDRNGFPDAFLYERASGANTAVSRAASGQASATSLQPFDFSPADPAVPSAGGRFVAYASIAPDLGPGQVDANGARDVFLFDHVTASNILVSRAAGTTATAGNAVSSQPDLSADGGFVAFLSEAGNLVPGQAGFGAQVFLFDRQGGTTTLVSRAHGTTATTANSSAGPPSISADGNRVAFASDATDLVAGSEPCCGVSNVYVFDRSGGTVTLLSRAAGAATPADGNSVEPQISADGRYVLYLSSASNLVPGQTQGGVDHLYLTEVATGATVLVSRSSSSPTTPADAPAFGGALSADGRFVAFRSFAGNLVPGQAALPSSSSIFLFDRQTGTTRLVSGAGGSPTVRANGFSSEAAISADGRFVAFTSSASDLIPGTVDQEGEDVFLFDRIASTLTLVSHASGSPATSANHRSFTPSISADGGAVAFLSRATNLVAGQTGDSQWENAYLYDRLTGRTEVVSRSLASETVAGEGFTVWPLVSADGRRVAFSSTARDLVARDFNILNDVFLYSRDLPPGLSFFTLPPCRRLDTRKPGQGPALASNVRRTIAVTGAACGVPVIAKAVAVNLTVTQPTGAGHLTLSPGDFVAIPTSSTINFAPGQTRANNAILSLAASGAGTLIADPFVTGGGTVHLIVDVVGYFE